jgi:hypothetical protein
MKKLTAAGAALAVFAGAVAMAGDADSKAACLAFAERNGVAPEPCECIADSVSGDADLKAEQLALVTLEDYEAASAALRGAIEACLEE